MENVDYTLVSRMLAGSDWDVVVRFLHWDGEFHHTMSREDQDRVRRLYADGFGRRQSNPDLVWDWSHVRDSSLEAVKDMADEIRAMVVAATTMRVRVEMAARKTANAGDSSAARHVFLLADGETFSAVARTEHDARMVLADERNARRSRAARYLGSVAAELEVV